MIDNPKISVIIPVYNTSQYLKQCIESVLNQTYENLEIIIIDDGSKDNSATICKNYQELDNRVVFFSQENCGISKTRNKAIEKVTGDYILFIDSDDWIDVNTCKTALDKLEAYNTDLVMFSYQKEYIEKIEKKYILQEEKYYLQQDINALHRRLVGLYKNELNNPEHADSLVTVWGKLYKSKIIKDNNLLFEDTKNIGTAEDMLFNLYYFKFVKSAYYIHQCLYHYRKNNSVSFTNKYKPDLQKQWNNLFTNISNFIFENNLGEKFTQAYNNRVSLSIIGLGLNELNANKSTVAKINTIKQIATSPTYRTAVKTLNLKYFPIHWKIFFYFAKNKFTLGLFFMLKIIKYLISKNN